MRIIVDTSDVFLPIPSGDTATDPIGSPADLRQRWRALMGPLGFGERLLRLAFAGPDRCLLKVLSDMPIGAKPAPAVVENLMGAPSELVAGLGEGTTRFDVPIEPIFRANDEAIVLLGRAQAA